MKVLILANNDVGLYKFRRELIEELLFPGKYIKENKIEPCKVYISLPEGSFIPELQKIGCQFINTPIDCRGVNPIKDLKLMVTYRKILKKVKPDIVFGYTIKPNVYGGMMCASLGIPYVVNITGLGTAVEKGGMLQKITLGLYHIGLRKAQKVFFQNTENRDFMIKQHVIKTAFDMLPGSGVNLKEYQVLEYPVGENINFIFVARVMKEKGIDQYLEAAKYIRSRYPKTRFHICGFCEEDYKNVLEELARQGIIIYHGLVDNMREIYQMAACTIHPTYYPEGLSNVLTEKIPELVPPIITTNRSGCREVIDDGINGYVVEKQNSRRILLKRLRCFE